MQKRRDEATADMDSNIILVLSLDEDYKIVSFFNRSWPWLVELLTVY